MKLSRRSVLQWSGASLFAPLMRQTFAAGQVPARVVLVLEGNSFYPSTVMSDATRAAIVAAGGSPVTAFANTHNTYKHTTPLVVPSSAIDTASALTPLSVGGLGNKSAVVFGLSSAVTGGGHSSNHGALSCSRGGTSPAGPTIDTVLGQTLRGQTPFDVLRVGVESSTARVSYATCAFDKARAAPIMLNTADVYQRLFGVLAQGASSPAVAKNGRLLDFAHRDASAALRTFSGSSAERAKLEAYLGAMETIQARNVKLGSMRDAVLPLVPATAPTGDEADLFARLESQLEMVGAALIGGLTNVATVVSGPGGGLSNLYSSVFATVPGWPTASMNINRHDLQHGVGQDINKTAITAVTRRHVELIAALARRLDATPEPGSTGSMLDHTAIVFMSDNGEQHHSTGSEWPAVLIGGSKLGLKTDGRTVVYPVNGSSRRQVSNLFNTLGHAAGNQQLNAFGLEGGLRLAEGPLSELIG